MSASSKSVDVLPLSAVNFDEVKRKIATCASFEALRLSMLEGGARPEIGGASGQQDPGAGLPPTGLGFTTDGSGATGGSTGGGSGATSAKGDSGDHAWSQSIPDYEQRLAELVELCKVPRKWTSKNFKEVVTGEELCKRCREVCGRFREGVSFDMTARALSGDIIFQTRLRADSLARGANLSSFSGPRRDDYFVEFVELNCFRPLQIELQEKRAEALFQRLQHGGLVVDDALGAGSRSLVCGEVVCDPMPEHFGPDDKGRNIILSTFRAQARSGRNPNWAPDELFDLRVRTHWYGSRSGLEFCAFAREKTSEFRMDGNCIAPFLDWSSKSVSGGAFPPEHVRNFLQKFSVETHQDRGLRWCVKYLSYQQPMEWLFDSTEKRNAVYDVINSAAEQLLDTNNTSAITAAVTAQHPERFSSKIIDILDYDNQGRLAYLIDAGPHSLPVTYETTFLETVDFVNSPEFLEFHDLTDDKEAKQRLTYELRIVLKREPEVEE